MGFCTQCGAELADGSRFCPACGARVERFRAAEVTAAAQGAAHVIMHDVAAPAAAGELVVASWQDPSLQVVAAAQAAAGFAGAAQGAAGVAGSAGSAHQSGGAAPSGPSADAAQGAKKKSCLPRVVGGVLVLALLAVIALYVVPLFIPHPVDPHEHTVYTPPASEGESGDVSGSSAQQNGDISQGLSESDTQGNDVAQGLVPGLSAEEYSTLEEPTLGDFLWMTPDIMDGSVPAGAAVITDLSAVLGGWKCYMYDDTGLERFAHASIEATQAGASVLVEWLYVYDGTIGEGYVDDSPNTLFIGSWEGGSIDASDAGRLVLSAFWEQDGHQYAVGTLLWPSGEASAVALVRP